VLDDLTGANQVRLLLHGFVRPRKENGAGF
jgi:hypothetical protein